MFRAGRARLCYRGCMPPVALAGLVLVVSLLAPSAVRAQDVSDVARCQEWQACQARALDAATRGDYETFHDLAWRTVQLGPRRPDLMLLLARAQSLSGRPDDALVMLRRMAQSGTAPTEALTSDDFRRVRARPGWAEVESLIITLWYCD